MRYGLWICNLESEIELIYVLYVFILVAILTFPPSFVFNDLSVLTFKSFTLWAFLDF
jgi:hypothetical protein